MQSSIRFTLNGKLVKILNADNHTLLWILRTHFGLTGAKYGCGEGFCGSCTVLIDGIAVRSCHTMAKKISGKAVITIEGLAKNGNLHPIQKAFIKHDALQCGYCTPGMILSALGFLHTNPTPSREEIIDEMDNNLCRCGSYSRILDAIQEAAEEMRGVRSNEIKK